MAKFTPNRMQLSKYKELINYESSFRRCFKVNITKDWWDDVKSKDHVVLFIHGETGSYKSSSGQEIGKTLQGDFNAKQIAFDNQDLLDRFRKSKPGDVYIRDESPDLWGVGSMRIASQVLLLAEALRKRKNSLIFIAPTQRSYIESAHYNLMTIPPISDDKKWARLGVLDPQTRTFLGAILIEIHFNNPVWEDYEIKKNKFLEKVPMMLFEKLNIEKCARVALKKIDLKVDKRKGERLLRLKQFFPYTAQEVKDIAIRLEQIIREEELL